jgi:hypothetical protein
VVTALSLGARVVRRPVFLAALVAGASLVGYACGGRAGPGATTGPSPVPPPVGTGSGPACVDQFPLDDCVDYAIEREHVVALLEDLEQARDIRSIPVAESALGSGDPVVVTAGLRLLGPFADKSETAAARAVPLMTSPYLSTQELAASVLERSPKHAALAQQYRIGHRSTPDLDPWAKALPVDLFSMGFPPPYPNSTPFAPGDSPQSAALATTDAIDTVIAHYRTELRRDPVPWSTLEATFAARTTKTYEDLAKQIQALQVEYVKTQDPKLLEKMQELSKAASQSTESSLSKAPFPSAPTNANAQAFIAEQDGEIPIRVVVAYPEPLLGRTVVMLAWGGPKYPPKPRTPKPPKHLSRP